jgi:hypothetical protein
MIAMTTAIMTVTAITIVMITSAGLHTIRRDGTMAAKLAGVVAMCLRDKLRK